MQPRFGLPLAVGIFAAVAALLSSLPAVARLTGQPFLFHSVAFALAMAIGAWIARDPYSGHRPPLLMMAVGIATLKATAGWLMSWLLYVLVNKPPFNDIAHPYLPAFGILSAVLQGIAC